MKADKYRLYPNAGQKVLIARHFGCARFVYNLPLSEKDKHDKETGKTLLASLANFLGSGIG